MKNSKYLISASVILVSAFLIYINFYATAPTINEHTAASDIVQKLYSPSYKYYAVQKYLRSEFVACCGSSVADYEKKYYSVSIYRSDDDALIREFINFDIHPIESFTPMIDEWQSDNILKMFAGGTLEAFPVLYNISEDKVIPGWVEGE